MWRRVWQTSTACFHASRATRTVMSPPAISVPTTASPSASVSASSSPWRSSSTWGASGASASDDNRLTLPALGHVLVLDALLQEDDALEQRLGPRRAAGHVHVDGDDLVDALGDGVAVPVGAAAVGARPHGDDVLGVGHLLVETADRHGHLVGDGAGDDHEVGLPGAGRERDDTEAHDVVARRAECRAHLDGAAGQAPLVHPQAVLAGGIEEVAERLRDLAGLDETQLAHRRV